jgi:hypothetical protein
VQPSKLKDDAKTTMALSKKKSDDRFMFIFLTDERSWMNKAMAIIKQINRTT